MLWLVIEPIFLTLTFEKRYILVRELIFEANYRKLIDVKRDPKSTIIRSLLSFLFFLLTGRRLNIPDAEIITKSFSFLSLSLFRSFFKSSI